MSEVDYGFGKCACGKWAIVKLNGSARCLSCFEAGLMGVRDRLDSALRALEGREEKPND